MTEKLKQITYICTECKSITQDYSYEKFRKDEILYRDYKICPCYSREVKITEIKTLDAHSQSWISHPGILAIESWLKKHLQKTWENGKAGNK